MKNNRGDAPLKTMKKLFFLFIIQHLAFSIYAQSGTMLPDGFIVPNLATAPACTVADKGKTYYNTTSNQMMVCNGTSWVGATEVWGKTGNNIFYTAGKVGINLPSPLYDLDVNGTGRFTNASATGLGIGGAAPSSGLEVYNGAIAITNTADAKTWKYEYSEPNNYLSLQENGVIRMIFNNGGNIGIGAAPPAEKLSVDGNGSFTGDLTVNGGKGLVRSFNSTQLKYHLATVSLGASFTVNAASCQTATSSTLSPAGFTASPTVTVANLVSGTGDFGKLVTIVSSTTTTQATIRICNPTASSITLSNIFFNLICIGQ